MGLYNSMSSATLETTVELVEQSGVGIQKRRGIVVLTISYHHVSWIMFTCLQWHFVDMKLAMVCRAYSITGCHNTDYCCICSFRCLLLMSQALYNSILRYKDISKARSWDLVRLALD